MTQNKNQNILYIWTQGSYEVMQIFSNGRLQMNRP